MQCSKCKAENRAGATFCDACGAALEYKCTACGAEVRPHSRFCDRCGAEFDSGEKVPQVKEGMPTPAESAAPPSISRSGTSPSPFPGLPGKQIEAIGGGRYQVINFVGEGRRKIVYRAHDVRIDRDVAISIIKTEGMSEHELSRLKREVKAMAWLGDHPNIVTIYDLGEEDGLTYIVSQFMDGGDVAGALRTAPGKKFSIDQALEITTQVARALEHAHEKGIVHRDIKPANVWLSSDGTARLGDFGMVMISGATRITATGVMLGTINYMAPEIILGKSREADARCDIYSLGVMLYEMLTGTLPFQGSVDDVIEGHLNRIADPPSIVVPEITPELDSLVLWMLAKAPKNRPRNAQMLLQSIAAIKAGKADRGPAVVAAALEGTALVREDEPPSEISPTRATAVMPVFPAASEPSDATVSTPSPATGIGEVAGQEGEGSAHVLPEPALEEGPISTDTQDGIVGRDHELADLDWVLSEAVAGRGRFVVIRGSQGSGRSRLARAIVDRASERYAYTYTVVCRKEDRPGPFHYWMPLIVELLDRYESSKLAMDLGGAAEDLARVLPRGLSTREKLIAIADREGVEHVGSDEDRLVRGLTRLLRRLAASVPFVALLDDIEWADEQSLRLLEELAHGANIISMLLLATCEANPPSARARAFLKRLESVESRKVVELRNLDLEATGALAGQVLGRAPRMPLQSGLFEATGGNPLHVLTYVHALRSENALEGEALPEEWIQKIPNDLVEAVNRQLASFGEDERRVLHEASPIGDEVGLPFLSALTTCDENELRALLRPAEYSGLVEVRGDLLIFEHRLLRDAICRTVPEIPTGIDPAGWAQWRHGVLAATRIAMAGDYESAEELAENAHRLGTSIGMVEEADQVFSMQIYCIRKHQGKLADLEAALKTVAKAMPRDVRWHAAIIAADVECGRLVEARKGLASLAADNFAAVLEAEDALAVMASLAQIAVQLRDGARCSQLYELMKAYSGRVVFFGSHAYCEGAIDRELGLLADALARDDEAVMYLESAIAQNEMLGALVAAAMAKRELGVALIHRGATGDVKRAATLLREAEATFYSVDLPDLAMQAGAVAASAESEPVVSSNVGESVSTQSGLHELRASLKSSPPNLANVASEREGAITLVVLSGDPGSEIEADVDSGQIVARVPGAMLMSYGSADDALEEVSAIMAGNTRSKEKRISAAVHAVSTSSISGNALMDGIDLLVSIAAACNEGEILASSAAHDLRSDPHQPVDERLVELEGHPGSHRVFSVLYC